MVNASYITPGWILTAIGLTVLSGIFVLMFGRRLPRQGDWLVAFGLFGLLVLVVVDAIASVEARTLPQIWFRGWILPKDVQGAIQVGILRDLPGLTMAALAPLLAGLVLFGSGSPAPGIRRERYLAAASIGSAGVALAWLSLTTWMSFAGILLSGLGGMAALHSHQARPTEELLTTRFGRERAWALMLSLIGAFALASEGVKMTLGNQAILGAVHGEVWTFALETSPEIWLGALLLMVGLVIQLQPFPFLGWCVVRSEAAVPVFRVVFAQVFPAWAAFSVLFRLEPQFRLVEILPVFGWFAVASVLLTALMGLLQEDWRQGLGLWVSATFGLALAALSFSGPWACLALLISAGFGAAALAMSGAMLREKAGKKELGSGRMLVWSKVNVIWAACVGTGFVGMLSAGGVIRWLTARADQPASLAVFAAIFLTHALMVWRLTWILLKMKAVVSPSWLKILMPTLLLLFCIGIVWTGTFTGAALWDDPDRLTVSFIDQLASRDGHGLTEDSLWLASWVEWGLLLVAMVVAYWTAGRDLDQWLKLRRAFPRITVFFAEGYGVDRGTKHFVRALKWAGLSLNLLVDGKIWGKWIPSGLKWITTRVGASVSKVDLFVSSSLNQGVKTATEAPAKVLQLIQNGNVQWYLFFAVGSGIVILLHFLRF